MNILADMKYIVENQHLYKSRRLIEKRLNFY